MPAPAATPEATATEGIHRTAGAAPGRIGRLRQLLALVVNRLVDAEGDQALPADLRLGGNLQPDQELAGGSAAEQLL